MGQYRLLGWTVFGVACMLAAGALLPIPPGLLSTALDTAFAATLHEGAARGLPVGVQLISTFGPLGFVFYDLYDPRTYAWLLGVRALLAAVTCAALAWIGWRQSRSPWSAALIVLLCAPMLASPDVWFLTLPVLAALAAWPLARHGELAPPPRAPAALQAALGVALGCVALIKFTFFLGVLVVLLPLTVLDLSARRLPLLALATLIAGATAWMASGQDAGSALAYLRWSLGDLTPGYSAAMQIPTDPRLTMHAAAVGAALAAAAIAVTRRPRLERWGRATAIAAILYLLLKAGFTRADFHVWITVFGFVIVAVLLAFSWSRRLGELALAGALVLLLPGGLWLHAALVGAPAAGYFAAVWPPRAIERLAALPLLFGDALGRAHARQLGALRAAMPLPPIAGPVDAYPIDQALLLAHALDLHPRPVFHSYMAYTPALAHANGEFLLGAHAPQWILFRVRPIDTRLPALDDAPSWPVLLTHYRLAEPAARFAVLERRAVPLRWRLEPLDRIETATGDPVPMPPGAGLVWARIDVHETLRDALVAAAWSARLVSVRVDLADGTGRVFRLVPALARDGFLLSPLIETTAQFATLLAADGTIDPAQGVAALAIGLGDAPGVAPGPRPVTIELFRLVVDQA